MKIIARLFGVCTMLVLTTMIFLETMGLTIRQDELNNCISSAVTTTQIVMKENIEDQVYGTNNARKKITSNEDYLNLFKRNLDKLRTTNSKYKIKVYGVDYTKGYIDVGIDATYPMLNGGVRTLTSRQTNLVEVYQNGDYNPVYGNAPDNFSYTGVFDYTGEVQKWTAPKSGKYKIEVWGASSGRYMRDDTYTDSAVAYGSYSVGYLTVENGQELYVSVGGQGKDGIFGQADGGWNGGGSGDWDHNLNEWQGKNEATAGGGGATSVTTSLIGDGQLKNYESVKYTDVVIVAGGAGSTCDSTPTSGHAGGFQGNDGIPAGSSSVKDNVPGATQTTGYKFGEGQSAVRNGNLYLNSEIGAGGGGWYGGSSPNDVTDYVYNYGSGGSGYIGFNQLTGDGDDAPKHMAGYKVATSDDADTRTISVDEASATPEADKAKIGNGYARITYVNNNAAGSPNYKALFTMIEDNDQNHIVSVGDVLEATSDLYASDSASNPTKYVVIDTSDSYAKVMALEDYKKQAFGSTGTEMFTDGNQYLKYDGSSVDSLLNVDFYNGLSNLAKKAMRQKEIYQSCYSISDAAVTENSVNGTRLDGSQYFLDQSANALVGQHQSTSNLAASRLYGNQKYIYLPDVSEITVALGNGWTGNAVTKLVFNSDAAVSKQILTRSVNTTGNVYIVNGSNGDITIGDQNTSYGVRPTFEIDKTAIVTAEYNWGGNPTYTAAYKQRLAEAGFKQVEYVEGTGKQWIDTGVIPTKKMWLDMDFTVSNTANNWHFMVGSWCDLAFGTLGNQIGFATGGTYENPLSNVTIEKDRRYSLRLGQHNITLGNSTYMTGNSDNNEGSKKIMVFGASETSMDTGDRPYGWDADCYGAGRVYSLTIYDGKYGDTSSSNVVRKLVPVAAIDGSSAGLYDIEHNQYYLFKGDGNYRVGEDVQ